MPLFAAIVFAFTEWKSDAGNVFSTNKTSYFLWRSILFFASGKNDYAAQSGEKYQQTFPDAHYADPRFPFLRQYEAQDVLGPFMEESDTPPNVVILIIEGLADDFVHRYEGLRLMPFLDSLSKQSLYWDHFLTTGERSFAAVPSILGSLPHGEKGFAISDEMPYHFTLANVLRRNGYYCSFYYGQVGFFHNKKMFFGLSNAQRIFDRDCFDSSGAYPRTYVASDGNYFWGYDDRSLFRQSLACINSTTASQRLDVYFSGSMHYPFSVQHAERLDKRLLSQAQALSPGAYDYAKQNNVALRSVMFTDDALREYFQMFSKRADYKRTIFIITGDHPMRETRVKNSLKRYHVPLLIYSPLLRNSQVFHGTGSHFDLYETLLGYLNKRYRLNVPAYTIAQGRTLDTSAQYHATRAVYFMNDNREIIDYFDSNYFLANDKDLYAADVNWDLVPVADKKLLAHHREKLKAWREANYYACQSDRLMPDSVYFDFITQPLFIQNDTSMELKYEYSAARKFTCSNAPFYFDYSGQGEASNKHSMLMVMEIKDQKDSLLLWKSFGTPAHDKKFQFHEYLPHFNVKDSLIHVNLYFWNEAKKPFALRYKQAIYRLK